MMDSALRSDGLPLRRRDLLAVLVALGWLGGIAYWHRHIVMDDPWITFRYAANVLSGEEWCFNPGEPLEGYSNFLWVLLSIPALALGIEPLGAMRVVSAVCLATMAALLVWGLPRERNDRGAIIGRPFAALALAGCYPVAVWTGGGLETIAHALLVLGLVIAAARTTAEPTRCNMVLTGTLTAALALSRPEGIMFAAIPGFLLLRAADRAQRRVFALALGGALAAVAVYTAWRFLTYGTIVPNTVSAKVGGSALLSWWRGLTYLFAYFVKAPLVLIGVAAWGAWRLWRKRGERTLVERALLAPLLIALGLQLFLVLNVGGDWMPGYRFLTPMLPLLCVLAGFAYEAMPRFVATVIVGACILSAPLEAYFDRGSGSAVGLRSARWIAEKKSLVAPLEEIGMELRQLAQPGDTIAMSEAGVVPYLSGMRMIDLLGLVDREIAALPGGMHEKINSAEDAGLILKREPRFILLGFSVLADGRHPTWAADGHIANHPDFPKLYQVVKEWPRAMLGAGWSRHDGFMVLHERGAPPVAEGS